MAEWDIGGGLSCPPWVVPQHAPEDFNGEERMEARKAAAPERTQLEDLAREFPAGDHKTRSQGGTTLTYLSIDATIRRLNEVLGPGWSTNATTDVQLLDNGKYLAVTQLTLSATIDGTSKGAYGVGAMVNGDPDMAAKTALAEAIKKAGHQLGIGLYLWDADSRERIERLRKIEGMSEAALKTAVYKLAKEKLDKADPTAKDIAAHFGVKPGELTDGATLREILIGAEG